jgi:hypothetical protein
VFYGRQARRSKQGVCEGMDERRGRQGGRGALGKLSMGANGPAKARARRVVRQLASEGGRGESIWRLAS